MMGKDLSGNGRETAEHSEEKAGESADQVSAAWRDVPMSLAGLTSTTPAEHHSGKPQHQLDVVCPTWYAGHMIPDIVIDPIPPRDSFGHSHTPPLVQRQWGLGSPPAAGAGKKVRAHSDSSIVELEKSQRRLSSDTQQQHIPQALHPGTQEGRAAQLDAERHLERAARAPPTSGEVEGRPLPMEVDNSGMVRSGSDNTGLGGSSAGAGTREMGQSGYAPSGQASPQTSLVPSSPSSLSSFQAPEKSPKMYWLRRHSDSHMPPGSASSSSLAEEQLAVTSTVQTSRSQSTGDMELDPGSPAPSTPGHAMFTERIKLKKYLQRRYQSSLDKESGPTEAGLATAKTESTQPENQPPATRPSSPPTARQPAGDRSISPQPSSSQTSDRRTGAGDGGSGMAPPSRKPPRLSLQETMPLKLEPVSPVSGSDTEAETPVFFSPSFVSPRVFSDNSRWCHNVFQFPVTRMHQVGPQTGETEVKGVAVAPKEGWAQEESRGESSRGKGEEAGGKSPDGSRLRSASPVELSVYATAAAASPPEMQHSRCLSPIVYRMSGIQHRAHPAMGRSRSEGHMPSRPLSPVLQARCQASSPTAQSAQISPLPPFPSIIRQHTAMSHSQLSAPGSHPTPFSTYPASTSALSPRPVFQWSAPAPRASPEAEAGAAQLPSQFQSLTAPPAGTSTTSTSTSTRRTDPSKMIYCPFGDEVREQRLRQDGTAVFRCPVCSQLFPSYYYLANHMVNHLPSEVVCKGPGDANKVHLCKVCNRAFSRSDMLTRHMRLHTGLKPYECRTCGQVFSRSDHLHTHQRTHTGEKPYKCPRCPYAAPRRDMITRHMRIHTKHFTRRSGARHRAASTSSDVTSPPAETTSEVRRRNQSLSSIDSLESDQSASFRQSSTASTDADVLLEEEDADRRRHWSVTSADSVESTPDVGMVTSTSGSRHWSAESAESCAAPSPGSLLEEEEEGSTAVYRRLPAAADSLSTDVQMSFQRCAVTSDKDNTSSSEKSSPASIAMEDTAKTGAENK